MGVFLFFFSFLYLGGWGGGCKALCRLYLDFPMSEPLVCSRIVFIPFGG